VAAAARLGFAFVRLGRAGGFGGGDSGEATREKLTRDLLVRQERGTGAPGLVASEPSGLSTPCFLAVRSTGGDEAANHRKTETSTPSFKR
jgi:hypothetical protein